MTNEQWAKVALAIAHQNWDIPDEEEHDRWVAIAERCYEGTLTDEDRTELAEEHEYWSDYYGDEEWYDEG